MRPRALLRRAFPYLVIGIGGFALAYVIIFVFVLPSRIVPRPRPAYVPESNPALQPIDTPLHSPADSGPRFPVAPQAVANAAAMSVAPSVVGMALPDARGILNSDRLRTVVQRDTSSLDPPNTVLRQIPEGGSPVRADAAVTLVVSMLPPIVASDTTSARVPLRAAPAQHADSDSTRADTARHP